MAKAIRSTKHRKTRNPRVVETLRQDWVRSKSGLIVDELYIAKKYARAKAHHHCEQHHVFQDLISPGVFSVESDSAVRRRRPDSARWRYVWSTRPRPCRNGGRTPAERNFFDFSVPNAKIGTP